ncbi:MAG: lasso RiPP family leader peptide-containing protein [Gemmatimonadota bacterium]|nr:lasso RiPP family leader peptide-containing protein [Gemmatimonadota bacterium]
MYEKPELERFGTFRELTQIGSAAGSDISAVFGLGAGCNPNTSDPDFACARS